MNVVQILRAIQRPVIIFLVIGSIVGLALYLVVRFGDPSMARDVLVFLLGAGGVIMGFLFGERARRPGGG